ncbi:phage tail tube protein [Aminipila terrae]|uniref:Phage portal protein n=1 Tax=Aminipila terrae TaxID=2697030 RepID=A0A6P1ME20_9FIRM|nr:phage tail tube protein [Aminipila terrae]QHI72900.1 phage portal protein [Aminipila terrae]
MSDTYTKLADTLSSHEGKAYITINGKNRELFELSSITAQIELTVTSKRMLGTRMTQHKVTGAEGTGSMTMYFANSEMLKQTLTYLKNGTYPPITIQTYNEDTQSTVGRQEVVLGNVILNSIPAASIDDGSDDPITFDTDITFDTIECLRTFDLPENFR